MRCYLCKFFKWMQPHMYWHFENYAMRTFLDPWHSPKQSVSQWALCWIGCIVNFLKGALESRSPNGVLVLIRSCRNSFSFSHGFIRSLNEGRVLQNDFMIGVTFSDAAAVTDTLPAIWPLLRCNVSINYSSELIQQILAVSQNTARPCISFFMTKFSSGKGEFCT